jgi:hypothetical protein
MVFSNTLKEAMMPAGLTLRRPGLWLGLALTLCFLSLFATSPVSALPQIEVRVPDTTVAPGQQIPITISFTNRVDSVAAFSVWLKLNRPDIAKFNYTLVSGVAKGKFDTSSATIVTKGFEYLDVRSTIGNGLDMLVTGIANANGGPPAVRAPIPPSGLVKKLIVLYLDVLSISDTMSDRTGVIHIDKDFLDKFIFSRSDGTAIGVNQIAVTDTICYQCLQWVGQTCVNKVRKTSPPCDLTEIVQDTIPVMDTTKVKAYDGSLTLFAGCCVGTTGNVNASGIVDLADLSALVSYLMGGGYVLPTCP